MSHVITRRRPHLGQSVHSIRLFQIYYDHLFVIRMRFKTGEKKQFNSVMPEPGGGPLPLLLPPVLTDQLKFIYSEKATKFWEIFTLLLTTVHTVKSKVKILQNCVAFSEYMNFNLHKILKKYWISMDLSCKILLFQMQNILFLKELKSKLKYYFVLLCFP